LDTRPIEWQKSQSGEGIPAVCSRGNGKNINLDRS
jgi:hypothetical protein